jgi:protein TonB
MTAHAIALLDTEDPGLGRWSLAAAIVLAAHIGLAATYFWLVPEQIHGAAETDVVLVDLAPVAAAPDVPVEPPPEPEVMEPPPEIEPPPSAVILQPEPPKPRPPIKRVERKPPTPHPLAAAPILGNPAALASWRDLVVLQLQRAKHYPSGAQSRREQGVVTVSVSLNRSGGVVARHIVRGSGYSELDQEAVETIQRAQPFPPFPPSMGQARVDLTVPLRFALH